MFYRDYDDVSAKLLADLDADYSKIREKIKAMYPTKNFKHMLDYLALERFSYQSHNTDVKEWSYRMNARERNAGWRIDYFLVSAPFMDRVVSADIHNEIYGSDHCPVELVIE